jgi:hypothetical protein
VVAAVSGVSVGIGPSWPPTGTGVAGPTLASPA